MAERPQVALVLGGARSGKSAYALRLAERTGEPVLFVATARVDDEEMAARVAAHRSTRPPTWRTIEAPLCVGDAIRAEATGARTILVDCLTLLASNWLMETAGNPSTGAGDGPSSPTESADSSVCDAQMQEEIRALLDASVNAGAHLIVVSGEVGSGIVPAYPLGRVYRDLLGRANQAIAAASDAVFLMVAGIPIDLKRYAADESSWPLNLSG